MKKFKYRLQPLLKAKQHLERERQKKLAQALNGVAKQQDSLDQLGAENQSVLDRQRGRMAGQLKVSGLLAFSRYLLKIKKDSLATQELLKVFEREAASRQTQLLQATRERKRYERLKEKLQAKYTAEVHRVETRESDETALNSFRLKGRELAEDSSANG
jgi:flagellar FliJ protein